VVATAWVVVAAVVGVLVGRMVRERDRQVPPAPEQPTATGDTDVPRHRVPGWGRQRRS
jgi:hypothetical protein